MLPESGYDFFHETGFATDAEARKAARAVWRRVGALFLQRRDVTRKAREIPWAQEQFGDPPCR